MGDAFDKVIENGKIPEVDGFKVTIVWDNDRFYYPFYMKLSRGTIELRGTGFGVIGHETAEKGGYSVHFMGASADNQFVAVHVRQGRFGIVYERENKGLLRPRVIENMEEFEFIPFIAGRYGIIAKGRTQEPPQR
jgi:hypothetical protein